MNQKKDSAKESGNMEAKTCADHIHMPVSITPDFNK